MNLVLPLAAAGLALLVASGGGTSPGPRSGRFTLAVLTASPTARQLGITNHPPPEARAALARVVEHVLEPLQAHLPSPIRITSGYRSPALNAAVGGSPTSQHQVGEAVDFQVAGFPPLQLVEIIRELRLPVDQCIAEPTWVHVSYGPRHRRQFLRAIGDNMVPL